MREVGLKIKVDDSELDALNRRLMATNRGRIESPGPESVAASDAARRAVAEYTNTLNASVKAKYAAITASNTLNSKLAATKPVAERVAAAHTAVKKATEELSPAMKAVGDVTDVVASRAGGLAGGLSRVATAAGPVGIAIAAVTVAVAALVIIAVVLAKQILDITKRFADYAIETGNAAEANGLMVETWSAMTAEAEAQGRSITDLNGGMKTLRKTIGEAAGGSREARAALKELGIDGSKYIYDIDGAFKQAVSAIAKAPTQIEQVRLATAAFGDDGAKLIPMFREMGGDVDKVIRKAQELGYVLGGPDVAAAREFNRAYSEVKQVLTGVGLTFVREFLPSVIKTIREFGVWLAENKDQIKDWATWGGGWVAWFVEKLDLLAQKMAQIKRDGDEMYRMEMANQGVTLPPSWVGKPAGKPMDHLIEGNALPVSQADAEAARAMLAYQAEQVEKAQKEAIERAKQGWAAAIQSWEMHGSEAGKSLTDVYEKLKTQFDELGNVSHFQQSAATAVQSYIATITNAYQELDALEDERDRRNNVTDAQNQLREQQQNQRWQEWIGKARTIEAQSAKAVTDHQKKASADYLKDLEVTMTRATEIRSARNQTDIALAQQADVQTFISEKAMIEKINGLEMDSLTFRKTELDKYLQKVIGVKDKEADVRHQLAMLDQQITQQGVTNSNRIAEGERKRLETIAAIKKAYEGMRDNFDDQITVLQRGGRPLSMYEQTIRDLERDYKSLDPVQKKNLLNMAAEIDALTELNRQHAELKGFFKDSLRYVFEGNFEGLAQSWGDRIKDKLADSLGDIFATSVLGFNPNETKNPVARPIVDKLDQTNKILRSIAVGSGAGASTGAGGGGIGGILSRIFGGGSGQGPGGTPNFNPSGGGVAGSDGLSSPWLTDMTAMLGGGSSSGGNGILGNLKKLFSSGAGGIFAPVGGSKFAGWASGAGQLATIVGSMIGGRAGGFISSVGSGISTGASIGAMFGPLGAGIGAVAGGIVGALMGLFGGNKQRRQDEQTRNQAMLDAQAAIRSQFDNLATQLRFGTIDPASAVNQGRSIGQNVRDSYIQAMSQLKDKKTRNIALADVSRLDSLIAQRMAELQGLADRAAGSADRMKRILPEFAGGTFISSAFRNFQRVNGMLSGSWTGRDYRAALLADAEMVLNPMQQNNVRRAAGFDVFAGAGIPNYPSATPSVAMAGGGISGGFPMQSQQIVMSPQFTIFVEGVTFDDASRAWVESDDGTRTLVTVIQKEQKRGSI